MATPAVEVGDRQGMLYAFDLAGGSVTPGWGGGHGQTVGSGQGCANSNPGGGTPALGSDGLAVPGSPPIDSTASVDDAHGGDLYFGAGNAASPVDGGYYAYSPGGSPVWNQVVTNPPSDSAPDGGVQASLSLGDGGSLVEGGSLGQMTYALSSASGAPATGWPQFSADSVFSTAAVGDLYGTGSDDFVVRGGAVLRVRLRHPLHRRRPPADLQRPRRTGLQRLHEPRRSTRPPPSGPILPGGAYGIVTGTGSYFPGASDQDTVKVYDTRCDQVWSDHLDGSTGGSPALADVLGNGQLAVVEGTDSGGSGSVWALNAGYGRHHLEGPRGSAPSSGR